MRKTLIDIEIFAFSTSFIGFIIALIYRQMLYGFMPLSFAFLMHSLNRRNNEYKVEIIEKSNGENKFYPINKYKKITALLWDYENVGCSSEGDISKVKRYFINDNEIKKLVVFLNKNTKTSIIQEFRSLGFEICYTEWGKNSLDIKLSIDCIKLALIETQIDKFILLGQDKDYFILINELQMMNKEVELVGWSGKQCKLSKQMNFIDIETVLGKNIISYEDALQCLINTIKDKKSTGEKVMIGSLDGYMRSNLKFSYDGVKSIYCKDKKVYRKFIDFLNSAVEAGYIRLEEINSDKSVELSKEVESSEE